VFFFFGHDDTIHIAHRLALKNLHYNKATVPNEQYAAMHRTAVILFGT